MVPEEVLFSLVLRFLCFLCHSCFLDHTHGNQVTKRAEEWSGLKNKKTKKNQTILKYEESSLNLHAQIYLDFLRLFFLISRLSISSVFLSHNSMWHLYELVKLKSKWETYIFALILSSNLLPLQQCFQTFFPLLSPQRALSDNSY